MGKAKRIRKMRSRLRRTKRMKRAVVEVSNSLMDLLVKPYFGGQSVVRSLFKVEPLNPTDEVE